MNLNPARCFQWSFDDVLPRSEYHLRLKIPNLDLDWNSRTPNWTNNNNAGCCLGTIGKILVRPMIW